MSNNSNVNGQGNQSAQKRASALDPRTPLLVQPFKRLVEEGFILEISVSFTPTGTTSKGKPDDRMIAVKDSGLVKGQEYPVGQLASVAEKGDLIPLRGKGKKKITEGPKGQPLPEKSLVKADFEKTPAELMARMQAVAQKSTGSTLTGRVLSENAFNGTINTKFSDWWRTASGKERLISLTLFRYRNLMGEEEETKMAGMNQCPFRGPDVFPTGEEKEDTTDKKKSGGASTSN